MTRQELSISSNSARLPELDGIRGAAISLVVLYHWFVLPGLTSGSVLPFRAVAYGMLGWSGVDLFFVLSGYLIGGILIDNRAASNFFKVFYLRRFFRILPLYCVVVLLFSLVTALGMSTATPVHAWLFENSLPWYAYLTFIQNIVMTIKGTMGSRVIDATWSLAVEEQFYLTLPFIVRMTRPALLPYVVAALALLAPCFRILLLLTTSHWSVGAYVLMPCRMDALMLGVLAAILMRSTLQREWLVQKRWLLYAAAVMFAVGMLVATRRNWDLRSPVMASIGYSWIACFYFTLLLVIVTRPTELVGRLFRGKLIGTLGVLAYGIYLFHQPVLGIVHGVLRGATPDLTTFGALVTTTIALGLLIGLAWLSWNFFELPLVTLGHRHVYARNELKADARAQKASQGA